MIALYLVFFCIGALAIGGGYVILPLMQSYIVDMYHWINTANLIDIVAISQITPGPIAINAATFVGMKKLGILGAIVATLGVISPQIIILSIFLKFIGLKNKIVIKMVDGIKPATISLIIIATINIFKSSIFKNNTLEYRALICFFIAILLDRLKIKFIYIIIICGIISFMI